MTGRRWPGPDRGAFTAEFAVGLPALVLLLLAGLTAVAAMLTKAQCVDAAREAALAVARGEPASPEAAVVVDGDEVTARVSRPVRLGGANLPVITVSGSATAAAEPGAGP